MLSLIIGVFVLQVVFSLSEGSIFAEGNPPSMPSKPRHVSIVTKPLTLQEIIARNRGEKSHSSANALSSSNANVAPESTTMDSRDATLVNSLVAVAQMQRDEWLEIEEGSEFGLEKEEREVDAEMDRKRRERNHGAIVTYRDEEEDDWGQFLLVREVDKHPKEDAKTRRKRSAPTPPPEDPPSLDEKGSGDEVDWSGYQGSL